MNNYPDLSQVSKADHLLFDIGFSAGIIHKTEQLLKELLPQIEGGSSLAPEIVDLLACIDEFNKGRLQLRSEIYDNAAAAAQKGTCNESN